jgi:hypothetical protein
MDSEAFRKGAIATDFLQKHIFKTI